MGLDYIHCHCDIIHTDLKPENVMLTEALRPRPDPAIASAQAAAAAAPHAHASSAAAAQASSTSHLQTTP